MRLVSEASRTVVPRRLRICSFERLIMPWRLPAWPVLTFPLAVNRKRFLAPDFVFSLGILRLLFAAQGLIPARIRLIQPPRHALYAGRHRFERGVIREAAGFASRPKLPGRPPWPGRRWCS